MQTEPLLTRGPLTRSEEHDQKIHPSWSRRWARRRWYEPELGFAGDSFPNFEPYAFAILRCDDVEIFLMRIEGYTKPDL